MVYFVGAGPGDADLITVKGASLLKEADVIIYAGSLVNPEHLKLAKRDAEIYDSASMTLDEVLKVMVEAVNQGKMVVRLHTGDPSLYGAIQEQMDQLHKLEIPTKVVPGVSSFFAAAASIKRELTLPDVSQTVILTRLSGRTLVPEKESLESLASHRATMAIFLSVQQIEDVVRSLSKGISRYYPYSCSSKASWPNEKIVRGNLRDIAAKVEEEKIFKTAMILVGDAVATEEYSLSKLYDPSFTHEYREATK